MFVYLRNDEETRQERLARIGNNLPEEVDTLKERVDVLESLSHQAFGERKQSDAERAQKLSENLSRINDGNLAEHVSLLQVKLDYLFQVFIDVSRELEQITKK